jgi:diguanylate cyclase (GGDEF)-like protein/PAS domain S-box-containing protein
VPDLANPEMYQKVLESLQTGVYLVDRNQRIVFWNEGAEKITGYLRQEVVGRFCREQLLATDEANKSVLSDAADAIEQVLRDGKPTAAEVSLRHKAGYRIFVRLRAVAIRNSHGSIVGAAESFDESLSASDWDRRQSKLADYGCLDDITGVLTEKFTMSHLRGSLGTFTDLQVPFSILCIEVDNFEKLQTTYGRAVGAPVLRIVAQTLENSLRPTDFLGRVGDRQFLAILVECGASELDRTAARLKRMVQTSEVAWWGDRWTVTASFGGTSAAGGDTLESILSRAQPALAESLASGGNRITLAMPQLQKTKG